MYHNYYFIPINSVRMIEGTVHTLLEDRDHHITGVSYKEKDSGEMKVSKIDKYSVLTPFKNRVYKQMFKFNTSRQHKIAMVT